MPSLNVQGLSRRERLLMECIVARPGRVFVSCDLASGEPTVTGHYAQDKNYLWATMEGLGKAPFYKDGILFISDPYIMFGSIAHPDVVKAWWEEGKFKNWVTEQDAITETTKKVRNKVWKAAALGLNYGMGGKKLAKTLTESGTPTSEAEGKRLHGLFWDLFAGNRKFADGIAAYVTKHGSLVNEFGYRGTPEPHNAFNWLIQSSINGIICHWLRAVKDLAPWADFVTCIHDEIIFEIDENRLEEFQVLAKAAESVLNGELKWKTTLRTGFVSGKNFYTAK